MKKITKKKKRLLLIGIGFGVLVSAAVYTVAIAPLFEKDNLVYKEETVNRGTLTVGVLEGGNLTYGVTNQMYDLNLTVTTEEDETVTRYLEVEEVYVVSGQRIEEGEPVLKFTEASVSGVRKLLQAALADAKVTYVEAQSEYTLSKLQAEVDYESAMISKEYAGTIYENSQQSVSDNISLMTIQLQQLQEQRETLQENYQEAWEDYQEILEKYETVKTAYEAMGAEDIHAGIAYQKNYLTLKNQYESAEQKWKQAAEKISDNEKSIVEQTEKINQAVQKKKIEEMENLQNYETTNIEAKIAELEYNAELESLKEELQEAEEELEELQTQLDAFEAFVGEDGIIYADGSGMITQIGYEAGDKLIQEGILLAFARKEDMSITVDVSQEDIVNLEIGNSVKIEFSAYEDVIYEGIITSMITTETSAGTSTISYPVTITVQGDTSALYGGMTADVTFVTEEKEEVLFVSRKAIIEENGKTYVYKENTLGQKILCQVETGISNGVSVEIVSGLEEGDVIYIQTRAGSED